MVKCQFNAYNGMDKKRDLIYAHFFFVDMVGLSDPMISVKRQIKKIDALKNLIASCRTYKDTDKDAFLVVPTGDGMVIGFLKGPELPLKLAIELHKKLNEYNKGKSPEEMVKIRIGLNDGPVYVVTDLSGNENVWGPGIILAKRVMDIGDEGHILLTTRMAEALRELSDEYKTMIKPLHDYTIKHGKTLLLYSVYGKGIGNSAMPRDSMYQKSRMNIEITKRKLTTIYHKIDVALRIKDLKTMLTNHRRSYEIENISDEPMDQILHGIAIDVPRTFLDLKVRAIDGSGDELNITSINLDRPYQKEFTVSFPEPVLKYKKASYTLEYEVEEPERYLENHFFISCRKYAMSLVYPSDSALKPVIYDVKVEKEKKTKSNRQPVLKKAGDGLTKAVWGRTNVLEGQAFRLEW